MFKFFRKKEYPKYCETWIGILIEEIKYHDGIFNCIPNLKLLPIGHQWENERKELQKNGYILKNTIPRKFALTEKVEVWIKEYTT